MTFDEEILRRRTFAIISHPDAGKTTLTEKLLLYGGAIHVAGAVKSNKIRKTATSDWMDPAPCGVRLDGDREAARHIGCHLRNGI